MANNILKERYSQAEWNSYIAQASDGDNFASDLPTLNEVLVKNILPVVKFYTYVEIAGMYEQTRNFWAAHSSGRSSMWQMYEELHKLWPNLVSKQIKEAGEIIPVFREFFSKPNAVSLLNKPKQEVKEEV